MLLSLALLGASAVGAAELRPPAVPLVACDPYFSVWSTSDSLATDWPRHWTGSPQAFQSMVRVDGHAWRLMGAAPAIDTATQTSVTVLPTRSIYTFTAGPVAITLTFLTPALPQDLDQLGRPVGYLTWQARSTDGRPHQTELYFDSSAELVVNDATQPVAWSRPHVPGLTTLRVGSAAQPVLAKQGDNLRIDWGYLYVASADPVTAAVQAHETARLGFATHGTLAATDDTRQPRAANDDWPVLAFRWDLGAVGATAVERNLVVAYDDVYALEYLGRRLPAWWRRDGWGAAELLRAAVAERPSVTARCVRWDTELMADLTRVGGAKYAQLCALAFRQCVAGHKLVADVDGSPLWFSKENFSNGCIATVDVTYPSSPFMLAFSPALTRALLDPMLKYAAGGRWKFPFAPHDLGTYPLANGQVYGGGERTEDDQMPVEESANLLIVVTALAESEGRADYAQTWWPMLTRWAEYLRDHGIDPGNQLCTDDFAGHLAHNANLSIKAIVGLGCYAELCRRLGHHDEAVRWRQLAETGVQTFLQQADDGDHYRLAFDKPGTWSQKYNLVWDRILKLGLFPAEVARKEVAWYKAHLQPYGLPLDNRSAYTKADWCVWSATLAESRTDWDALVDPVWQFANDSPSRVPFSDWYWTTDAKQRGFQARSVVGGLFIKLLAEPELWRKWRHAGR